VLPGHNILIWDSTDSPESDLSDQIVLWRSYGEIGFPAAVSIPTLVEKNALVLRKRYLAWIYDLGSTKIDEKRLVDYLQLRSNFSYWWMTLLVEKSNWAKSPLITDAIRLFAFDDWAKQYSNISSIRLVSSNKALGDALRLWCDLRDINFESRPSSSAPAKQRSVKRRIFDCIPYTLQAGVWLLKYLVERWPLRGIGVDKWGQSLGKTTFISYFFNLLPEAIQEGRFEDRYWTRLPQVLDEKGIDSCWLHIYVKSSVVPNARSAANLLSRFNASHKQRQTHAALDSFLSVSVITNVIRDYFRVRRFGRLKSHVFYRQDLFKRPTIESALLPLFTKDWDRSFYGVDAIFNLMMLNLFERAFCRLPKQRIGIYLQENQGWEFAMIHAWRAGNHDNLVGFPHSTIQFWNLSYFFDSRVYCKKDSELPRPDSVAVSGDLIRSALVEGGYPSEELIQVEALRYLHLGSLHVKRQRTLGASNKQPHVLVLTDYLFLNTHRQMQMLCEIAAKIKNVDLTVKPHPACPIDPSDYPELSFTLSNEPISELLDDFDVAYTSSATSAAVDAYIAGLRVISVLDPTNLNLSPLRDIDSVEYVSSSEQLLEVLKKQRSANETNKNIARYFDSDPSLPRWQLLISNGSRC